MNRLTSSSPTVVPTTKVRRRTSFWRQKSAEFGARLHPTLARQCADSSPHRNSRLGLATPVHPAAFAPHFLAALGQLTAAVRLVGLRAVDGHFAARLILGALLVLLASSHRFVVGLSCVIRIHG